MRLAISNHYAESIVTIYTHIFYISPYSNWVGSSQVGYFYFYVRWYLHKLCFMYMFKDSILIHFQDTLWRPCSVEYLAVSYMISEIDHRKSL